MRILLFSIACQLGYTQAFSEYWRAGNESMTPSCENLIYCESVLLHDVQMSRLFNDSKTFVDMPLKYPATEIDAAYALLKNQTGGQVPSRVELREFVHKHFENRSIELEEWIMPDFQSNPSIVDRIKDPDYKVWAAELNEMWKLLGRKATKDVDTRPDMYSLLYVPNGFVVPGGRFRELYYWDTYWIVNGLMECDMYQTALGIIENMVHLVKKNGFVPNGGRVYYKRRSQPPMLISMVRSYYDKTGNFSYVQSILPQLDQEFEFWMTNRTTNFTKDGQDYKMIRYHAPSRGPRPESYREDYEIASRFETQTEKDDFYINIKSGAETGWDFSGRWFMRENGTNSSELADINTRSIVPVDLNSIIHMNAQIMCSWYNRTGNTTQADKYCKYEQRFFKSIREVLWRPDVGTWYDYDAQHHRHREYFYISNIVPLWTKSYNTSDEEVPDLVIQYLQNEKIIEANGTIKFFGTPTSLVQTSQQWDFPNAWPSMQAFIIQGLHWSESQVARNIAANLTYVWLHSNYSPFKKEMRKAMYEKYDSLIEGRIGRGGEYDGQTGFGWTNGVALELLSLYADSITYEKVTKNVILEPLKPLDSPAINETTNNSISDQLTVPELEHLSPGENTILTPSNISSLKFTSS